MKTLKALQQKPTFLWKPLRLVLFLSLGFSLCKCLLSSSKMCSGKEKKNLPSQICRMFQSISDFWVKGKKAREAETVRVHIPVVEKERGDPKYS